MRYICHIFCYFIMDFYHDKRLWLRNFIILILTLFGRIVVQGDHGGAVHVVELPAFDGPAEGDDGDDDDNERDGDEEVEDVHIIIRCEKY